MEQPRLVLAGEFPSVESPEVYQLTLEGEENLAHIYNDRSSTELLLDGNSILSVMLCATKKMDLRFHLCTCE